MQVIVDLSVEVPIPSVLVKVVDCVDHKKDWDFLENPSGGSPSSGGGGPNWGSDQSSLQLTLMRVSRESNQSMQARRGLRVQVNLPIFKEKRPRML